MAWRTDFVSENDFLSPIHIFQNCQPQGLSTKQDEVQVVKVRKDGKENTVVLPEKKELALTEEKVVEMETERLESYENHSFKVKADSQMIELQESVKKYREN